MSNAEHLSMCLLAICISSLEEEDIREMSIEWSTHFLIEMFVFLVLSSISCLYILEIDLLSVVSFAIIFSHSDGCLFTLLVVSFAVKKLSSFQVPLVYFCCC